MGISYVFKDQDGETQAALLIHDKSVDELGELTVNMPLRAITVGVDVLAEGFAKVHQDVPTTTSMVVRLKQGRIIKVRAVDNEGKLMDDVWPVLAVSVENASVYLHLMETGFLFHGL